MSKHRFEQALAREAIELVMQAHEGPNAEHEARLKAFRSRSERHAAALIQAQKEWTLMGQLAPPEQKTKRLALEARFASLWDHPRRLALPVMAAVLVVIAWVGFDRSATPPVVEPVVATLMPTLEFQTRRGERMQETLPDGSTLTLGWRTRVEVNFTDEQRHVELLTGSASFVVASDPLKPFTVRADDLLVRAIGTEFVVQHLGPERVEVAVREGRVSVRGSEASVEQSLGVEEALVVEQGVAGPVLRRSLTEIGAFRDDLLVFVDRPLVSALETLAPYTSFQLDTRYLSALDRLVTATFSVHKADAALFALLDTYQLTADVNLDNRLVLKPAPPERPRIR